MMKTNKQSIRKRRPGGGRKPKGPIRAKSEVFTTRITPDTRASIEAEAKRSGQSISQVAERLLMAGLESKKRSDNYRSLRAFCFLVESLGKDASSLGLLGIERDALARMQENWRTSPFRYRAFRLAVNQLLDLLQPQGKMESPLLAVDPVLERLKSADTPDYPGLAAATFKIFQEMLSSPEKLAEFMFQDLLRGLSHPQHRDYLLKEFPKGSEIAAAIRGEAYGLEDARNDLNLRIREEEVEK
jgi:hypothetical protein